MITTGRGRNCGSGRVDQFIETIQKLSMIHLVNLKVAPSNYFALVLRSGD